MTCSCPICIDDYSKEVKKVTCGFCKYDTCSWCIRQYLLGTPDAAHCMNCRKGWSREFLMENISSKFVLEDYKQHRENTLFDQERSLLPATQPYAEREVMVRIKKAEIVKCKKELENYEECLLVKNPTIADAKVVIEEIYNEIALYLRPSENVINFFTLNKNGRVCDGKYFLCGGTIVRGKCQRCNLKVCKDCGYVMWISTNNHICIPNILKETRKKDLIHKYWEVMESEIGPHYENFLEMMNTKKHEINRKIANIRTEILRIPTVGVNDASSSQNVVVKRTFVRACPADDCRGFLSSAWKCGMCNIFACSKCHEIIGEKKDGSHVCLKENLESAMLLAKETKPCPTCASAIFKISGCSQIWCTQCHTAFDWGTGKVVKEGPIHNPHYYEYLRQNGGEIRREVGNIVCDGLPHLHQIERIIRDPKIEQIHRLAGEAIDLQYWYGNHGGQVENRDVRIKYLLKDYDDNMFKKTLQMRVKSSEKIQNIGQVLDTLVMVLTTIFQHVVTSKKPIIVDTFFAEIEALRKYTNESMQKIGKLYQCKFPTIDEEFTLHRVGERKK